MEDSKLAAKGRRIIWQGHDKQDKELCERGAYQLYDALTNADEGSKQKAAKLVRKAFWLADEAEEYQGENPEKEEERYKEAGEKLKRFRELVGLNKESVRYTMNWWKAYRHKNREKLYNNMLKEHLIQFKNLSLAKENTKILIDSCRNGHDHNNWEYAEEKLKSYYRNLNL